MGRSVPSMGKAASAAQQSLALAAIGGALSARALQAVVGVRGPGGAGPGSVGSMIAIGNATDAPRGTAGPATGNRPGFASVLARIAASRVSRDQSDTSAALVAGLGAQPMTAMPDAPGVAEVDGVGTVAAPERGASRSGSMSYVRRDAATAMRAVSRLARALDRARSVSPTGSPFDSARAASDGTNPVSGGAPRPTDATSATPSASGSGRDGGARGTGAPRVAPATGPDAAVSAVEDAAIRVEAAIATGDGATVAAVVADVAKVVPDGLRFLLGQAAMALAGTEGALDLGMLLVGAFDGAITDLPALTGTAADQSSLAGLLVALRQMGATLEIGGPAAATAVAGASSGVSLDGAGVFAALAAALASAATDGEAPVGAGGVSASVPASPATGPAGAVVVDAPLAVAATVALSDMEGVTVIAVAEAGVATVVPLVAHAASRAGSAGANAVVAGADAAAMAVAEAPVDGAEGVPTVPTSPVVALAATAGAGVADGDEAGGQPAQGVSAPGSAGTSVLAGTGIAPGIRLGDADATGLASAASSAVAEFDLPEQVSPILVRLARLTGVGEAKQFMLRLSPEHLGPLSIRLTLRNGAIGVDLTTATPEARKALESALPQLRASLGEAGLRLERLDVSLRENGDEGSGRNAGRQGDQAPQRQSGEPGGQAGSGTGDGGREWAATILGRLHFDQDGRPFDLPTASSADQAPIELAPPTRDFVRAGGGETALSVTRALGVQSRVSVGLGAYGGRRAMAAAVEASKTGDGLPG